MPTIVDNVDISSSPILVVKLIILFIVFLAISYIINYIIVNSINYASMKLINSKVLDEGVSYAMFIFIMMFMVIYEVTYGTIYPKNEQRIILDPIILYPLSLLVSAIYVNKIKTCQI